MDKAPFPHGGDITGYRLRYGRDPLDFSASLNPFGMPPEVAAAAREAVSAAAAYPDPFCRDLAEAFAARLRLPPECLLFGNGAAEMIFRLVQAIRPRRALLPVPAFAEYEQALLASGCAVTHHYLREEHDFRLGDDILDAIVPGVDILFLCQPNNPTGQLAEPDRLAAVLRRCEQVGATLALDECFLAFVREPERVSLLPRIADCRRLFILGSFTKLYGMAGIRLGYGVSGDAALLAAMRSAGQPWSVSTIAQAAGLAALRADAFVARTLAAIADERERLPAAYARLGLRIFGSRANYIFFHAGTPELGRRLEEAGMLIRDCAGFRGLGAGYYRAAIRLREENDRLLGALGHILGR